MAVFELFVNDFFVMFQPGTLSNPSGVEVEQQLLMFDTAHSNHKIAGVRQNFNIGQSVKVRTSIKHVTVTDFLAMSVTGVKNLPPQTVVQIFAPWQVAKKVFWEQVFQTFVMAQTTTAPNAKPSINTLIFNQTAIGNVFRNIEVDQTFVMNSSGVGYEIDTCESASPYVLGGPNGSPE